MIYYKMDVEEALRRRGYSSYKLRGILPTMTLQRIKNGENITITTLNILCCLLRCKPEDIIGFKFTDEEKIKYFD